MYEAHENLSTSINNSSMIDQLTRIQAQYHVEKHLGTITLTRSLRKRSLIELTTKYLYWFNLNFKEQYLINDFQLTHRTNRPNSFIYLFILLILIGSLCQSYVIHYLTLYYIILFPLIILGLVLIIILFLYAIPFNQTQNMKKNFYVYLNILICLTLSTIFIVGGQYHSVQNFKYLFNSSEEFNGTITNTMINENSSQFNSTLNNTIIRFEDSIHRMTVEPRSHQDRLKK
jgi:hypothetical protein